MVYQVVDVFRLEFVENRHRYCTVGQRGEETYAPVGLIAGAEGHFVAFFQSAALEGNVQILDSLGNILVFECRSLIVGQGIAFPILANALFQHFVYRFEFHILIPFLVQARNSPLS